MVIFVQIIKTKTCSRMSKAEFRYEEVKGRAADVTAAEAEQRKEIRRLRQENVRSCPPLLAGPVVRRLRHESLEP